MRMSVKRHGVTLRHIASLSLTLRHFASLVTTLNVGSERGQIDQYKNTVCSIQAKTQQLNTKLKFEFGKIEAVVVVTVVVAVVVAHGDDDVVVVTTVVVFYRS